MHNKGYGYATLEERLDCEDESNYQVKFIANGNNLEKAKKILLSKYSFVGFVDHYDASLILMKRALNLGHNFDIRYQKINIAKNYFDDLNLSVSTSERIMENNKLDFELYDFAYKNIFLKMVQDYGPDLYKEIFLLRKSLKKNYKFNAFRINKSRIYRHFYYNLLV